VKKEKKRLKEKGSEGASVREKDPRKQKKKPPTEMKAFWLCKKGGAAEDSGHRIGAKPYISVSPKVTFELEEKTEVKHIKSGKDGGLHF